jgi:hypothetical protein
MKLPIDYNKLTQLQRKRVRDEYVKLQRGKCYHCDEYLHKSPTKEINELDINLALFPPNFLKYPIHLHHDHVTGLTIGAVHSRCNAVLWQYHGE